MGTTYFDAETAEVLTIIRIADEPQQPKSRYVYPGGYVTMGLVNITRLVKADLPADGYRLALLMAARAVPVTGLIHCSNREYAEEMGVSAAHISRLMGRLVKARFIHRVGPRAVIVNPGWCFRGTAIEHHAAMEAWAKLHPLSLVSEDERKTA